MRDCTHKLFRFENSCSTMNLWIIRNFAGSGIRLAKSRQDVMDIVFIEQLSVITTIGVYDWEQTIEQKLAFDIEMAG